MIESNKYIAERLENIRQWTDGDGKKEAERRKYFGPLIRAHVKLKLEGGEDAIDREGDEEELLTWRKRDQRVYKVEQSRQRQGQDEDLDDSTFSDNA